MAIVGSVPVLFCVVAVGGIVAAMICGFWGLMGLALTLNYHPEATLPQLFWAVFVLLVTTPAALHAVIWWRLFQNRALGFVGPAALLGGLALVMFGIYFAVIDRGDSVIYLSFALSGFLLVLSAYLAKSTMRARGVG
jgi:ABC-type sugar transport system permease subunit